MVSINIPLVGAGLAGQYVAPMVLTMVMPPEEGEEPTISPKVQQHLGVAAGVYAVSRDPMLAGAAGAIDYGLCKLYESVEPLGVLSPVRGGLAVATAQYAMSMM